jgi:hypothetical protein
MMSETLTETTFEDLEDIGSQEAQAVGRAIAEDFRSYTADLEMNADVDAENVRVVTDREEFEELQETLEAVGDSAYDHLAGYYSKLQEAVFNLSRGAGGVSTLVPPVSRHELFHHDNKSRFIGDIEEPINQIEEFQDLVGEKNASYILDNFFHNSYEVAVLMANSSEEVGRKVEEYRGDRFYSKSEVNELGYELQSVAEDEGIGTVPRDLGEGFAMFFDLHSRDQLQDYDLMNSEEEREEWYQKIDESGMYDESVEERVREIFGIYDNLSQFSEMSDEKALGYIATTVREKMIEAAERPEPETLEALSGQGYVQDRLGGTRVNEDLFPNSKGMSQYLEK